MREYGDQLHCIIQVALTRQAHGYQPWALNHKFKKKLDKKHELC